MVVRISRTEELQTRHLRLRVEGALTHEGAQLLVQQCVPCLHEAAWGVEIDLTAVTFIDEAAAAVVRRLSQSPGVSLTDCQLFTQQMIEVTPPVEGSQVGEGATRITPVHGAHTSSIDVTPNRRGFTPYQGGIMSHETIPQIPATMRAFAIDRFGELGTLRTLPTPEIGADEILVRVHAAGVNPLNEKIRDGFKAVAGVRFPLTLGQDAAGVVVRTGLNVTRFGVGSAVYGAFWLAGIFAEYVRVATTRVAVAYKPATLDFAQAAALPTPALAAVTALRAVTITTGDTLLIVGATGGVGSYTVQMAARCGARVIATARPDAEAYVRRLGAVEVIDYTQRDLVTAVKAMHPQGIDVLIDVISDRTVLPHMAEALAAMRAGHLRGKLVLMVA